MNVHAEISETEAIRAVVERCARGFRDLDLDAIMACHTDDVVCFDLHSQFEARGATAMRDFLAACFPYMQGPIVHEIHELTVEAEGNLGLAHYHLWSSCRDPQDGEHAGWCRVTLGLRRTDGDWKACHVHISAPFNPMTEKTMFGLPREASPWEGAACSGS